MPLPSSGPISLSQVNVELGLSATAQISMNDAAVRTLFGKPSGAISMSDGYGKANVLNLVFSSNQSNVNLRTAAINAGWNQASKVICTINSGVEITSTSTLNAALTISGSFPGGVDVINNGFIVGRGGDGGSGGSGNGTFGTAGGLGISVSTPVAITNNGVIGGGGGGGGGGGANQTSKGFFGGGGGGGGGGYGSGGGSFNGFSAGSGGILSGGAGFGWLVQPGGNGGFSGQAGASGTGGNRGAGRAGGAGGPAINGNSNISWVSTGTRYGAIS